MKKTTMPTIDISYSIEKRINDEFCDYIDFDEPTPTTHTVEEFIELMESQRGSLAENESLNLTQTTSIFVGGEMHSILHDLLKMTNAGFEDIYSEEGECWNE